MMKLGNEHKKMNMKLFFWVSVFMLAMFSAKGQSDSIAHAPFYTSEGEVWADSIMQILTIDEKIAQLFWIDIHADGTPYATKKYSDIIKNYKPGGILFFKTTPERLVDMNIFLNSFSDVPLFSGIDGEWGLGMRLKGAVSFPYQMTLGAISNDKFIYQMGSEVATQLKRLGLNANLAPVVDVNNNPDNPVIGRRSFGENPAKVADKAIAYINGMQSENILTFAKHFPGHGDTNVDSHKALPIITGTKEHMDSVELYPFRKVIEAGVTGVMSAHLDVPALESQSGVPATLSKSIIINLLKDSMGFNGLVITDAMNMGGVKVAGQPGRVDSKAVIAGNDIMEYTENLPAAIAEIKKAIRVGELTTKQVEESCRKSLMAKYWVGLNSYKPVSITNLSEDLNHGYTKWLRHKLYELSVTVLKNKNSILPIKELDKEKTVVVNFGTSDDVKGFYERYDNVDYVNVNNSVRYEDLITNRDSLTRYVLIVGGVNSVLLSDDRLKLFAFLVKKQHSIVVWHENPYRLTKLFEAQMADGLIITYQNNSTVRDIASQLVFGGIGATGRLPVSVKGMFKEGSGVDVEWMNRLSYTFPEESGLNSETIVAKVDSIINAGIEAGAFPGSSVLVAHHSKVIFRKAYGYHTYEKIHPVSKDDIFDLASVTKVSGPLPLLMLAYQNRMIDVDAPMSRYWKDWQKRIFHRSNKSDLTFREILAHQAGLQPYINYYPLTLKEGEFNKRFYSINEDEKYSLHIAQNLFLEDKFKKKVYREIRKSPLLDKKKYKYSGLSFIIYPQLLSEVYHANYAEQLYKEFYNPLGATTTRYTPLNYFPKYRIVPTEIDTNYRHELIHGYVHDEAAAVMGGVSGNAGLFSNTNDLAKLMQMYLNGGEYGGKRYLQEEVLKEFAKVQYPENDNRRGMGFDKPLFNNSSYSLANSYPAPGVSQQSFGHSGFTGIFVWMDPEYDLLYIFMSNRVYPTRNNALIYKLNIRPSVHQVFYDEIERGNLHQTPD